jgi:preprotein translocase subunit SecF
VLGRTIITTLTTMLAVIFLFIFAKGSMKDFALALLIGMVSGVYTTLFIATGFVNFWEDRKVRRQKIKQAASLKV